MPINLNGLPPSHLPHASAEAQAKLGRKEFTAQQQESCRPHTVDTMSLSGAATHLQQLEKRLVELSGVDIQRVEQLRKTIADGAYHVDPARVAEKLLAFESALPTKVDK